MHVVVTVCAGAMKLDTFMQGLTQRGEFVAILPAVFVCWHNPGVHYSVLMSGLLIMMNPTRARPVNV